MPLPKGSVKNAQWRRKIGESNIGKHFIKPSEETKRKMGVAAKGRVFTEDHKKNISVGLTGFKRPFTKEEMEVHLAN